MRRIAISAGHSNVKGEDRGAISNGYVEGELAVDLRNLIKIMCKQQHDVNVSIDPDNSVTFKTVALFKEYFNKGTDICVDIHFNASSTGLASGTLVLVPNNASQFEIDLATEICKWISTTLNISNRGVQPERYSARKKLLWMTIPAETILIEVCFIDNAKDMSSYSKNKIPLANGLANILVNFKNK